LSATEGDLDYKGSFSEGENAEKGVIVQVKSRYGEKRSLRLERMWGMRWARSGGGRGGFKSEGGERNELENLFVCAKTSDGYLALGGGGNGRGKQNRITRRGAAAGKRGTRV